MLKSPLIFIDINEYMNIGMCLLNTLDLTSKSSCFMRKETE